MAARPQQWRSPNGDRPRPSPQSSPNKPRNQRVDRRPRPAANGTDQAPPQPAAPAPENPPAALAPAPPPATAPRSWVNAATRPPPTQTENKNPQEVESKPPAPRSWADMAKKSAAPPTPPPAPAQPSTETPAPEAADDVSTSNPDTCSTPEPAAKEEEAAAKEEPAPVVPPPNAWGAQKPAAVLAAAEKGGVSIAAAEKSELCRNIWKLTEEALSSEAMMRQPRGLYNIGNLCFMNAVLQALVGCGAFYRLLRSLSNHNLKLPKEMPTLYSLITFASEFLHEEPDPPPPSAAAHDAQPDAQAPSSPSKAGPGSPGKAAPAGQGSPVRAAAPPPPAPQPQPQPAHAALAKGVPFTPDYFYDFLSAFSPTDPVRPGRGKARQEDAQEFLTYVLNLVNDELLVVMEGEDCGRPEAKGGEGEEVEEAVKAAEEVVDAGNDDEGWLEVGGKGETTAVRKMDTRETPITALFGGEFKTTIRYSGSKASASLEPFLSVSLDIYAREVSSVQDALRLYFAPEKLDGVFNDSTRQEGKASRFVQIAKPPTVLILHLKRFRFDGATAHKVVKKISYPPSLEMEESFLAATPSGPTKLNYTLTAVVSHHGNKLHSGHYTVNVRQPTGDWIRLDDHKVERASETQVLGEQQTAYLLLYQQERAA